MALFRSSRLRRIDRALSSVLDKLDRSYTEQVRALPDDHNWRDIDILAATRDNDACKAYDRANALEAQWLRRVRECEATDTWSF